MAYGFHRTRITYHLGWISAIAAVLYKILTVTWSARIARATQVWPLHVLEGSMMLFLISIASAQYASTYLRHEFPRYQSEDRRGEGSATSP